MSIRLFLLERWLPGPIRRGMFSELVRVTAAAFGSAAPDLGRLPPDAAVEAFARYTRQQVERAHDAGSAAAGDARDRLYLGARRMGATVRRAAGIGTHAEAMRALRLLYEAIGIEFAGDPRTGQVTVARCAFSRVYTPEVCAFISALDAGIADGITGATLVFTERITEGAPCCRARLSWSAPR